MAFRLMAKDYQYIQNKEHNAVYLLHELGNFIRPKRKILGASEICPTAHSSPGPDSPSGPGWLDQGSSELVIIDS